MDRPDTPEDRDSPDEGAPDISDWDSPETVLRGGPIRERLLDVVLGLREPTKVSTIAGRADCDTETAREYLEWFASMGIVREHAGRPVRYERNDSYLFWRRVERIREGHSEEEILEELDAAVESIDEYRAEYGADSPEGVSLLDASDGASIETVWEAVSAWRTLERRVELLEAALQDRYSPRGSVGSVDA